MYAIFIYKTSQVRQKETLHRKNTLLEFVKLIADPDIYIIDFLNEFKYSLIFISVFFNLSKSCIR